MNTTCFPAFLCPSIKVRWKKNDIKTHTLVLCCPEEIPSTNTTLRHALRCCGCTLESDAMDGAERTSCSWEQSASLQPLAPASGRWKWSRRFFKRGNEKWWSCPSEPHSTRGTVLLDAPIPQWQHCNNTKLPYEGKGGDGLVEGLGRGLLVKCEGKQFSVQSNDIVKSPATRLHHIMK